MSDKKTREIFKSLGLDFDESLEVKQLEDLYKLYFDDGEEIVFTTDRKKMEKQQNEYLKKKIKRNECTAGEISRNFQFN